MSFEHFVLDTEQRTLSSLIRKFLHGFLPAKRRDHHFSCPIEEKTESQEGYMLLLLLLLLSRKSMAC